jgi:hypothetical protein
MIDPSLMPELPIPAWARDHHGETEVFTKDDLSAYGLQCYQLAMERAAQVCEDVEEKPWYGYENPNTFQDAQWKCAAAIRALALQEKTDV